MIVKDIMDSDFLTVTENMDIETLAKTFIENKKDYALVVDSDGNLTGVVTETDLIFQEKNLHIPTVFTFFDSMIFLESVAKFNDEIKKISATRVGEIMSKNIITINGETSIKDAATLMLEKDIHHLPVLDNNKPIGVVTKEGLLKAFLKERQIKA